MSKVTIGLLSSGASDTKIAGISIDTGSNKIFITGKGTAATKALLFQAMAYIYNELNITDIDFINLHTIESKFKINSPGGFMRGFGCVISRSSAKDGSNTNVCSYSEIEKDGFIYEKLQATVKLGYDYIKEGKVKILFNESQIVIDESYEVREYGRYYNNSYKPSSIQPVDASFIEQQFPESTVKPATIPQDISEIVEKAIQQKIIPLEQKIEQMQKQIEELMKYKENSIKTIDDLVKKTNKPKPAIESKVEVPANPKEATVEQTSIEEPKEPKEPKTHVITNIGDYEDSKHEIRFVHGQREQNYKFNVKTIFGRPNSMLVQIDEDGYPTDSIDSQYKYARASQQNALAFLKGDGIFDSVDRYNYNNLTYVRLSDLTDEAAKIPNCCVC